MKSNTGCNRTFQREPFTKYCIIVLQNRSETQIEIGRARDRTTERYRRLIGDHRCHGVVNVGGGGGGRADRVYIGGRDRRDVGGRIAEGTGGGSPRRRSGARGHAQM